MSSLELEERKMEEGRAGQEAGVAGRTEKKEVYYYPRRNGWNCPWHPLQILAWAFIIFFTATYFGFLIFYIPGAWRSIGYIVSSLIPTVSHTFNINIKTSKQSVRSCPIHVF